MTDKELMQQALEKLEFFSHMKSVSEDTMRLITALRERLVEQPVQQQEPVGYFSVNDYGRWEENESEHGEPFYTSPQPTQPSQSRSDVKPLTDDQRKAIVVCFTSGKVSVSEVQRKLAISYNEAQKLCQSIADLGLAEGLQLAPSLNRHGIKGDA